MFLIKSIVQTQCNIDQAAFSNKLDISKHSKGVLLPLQDYRA